MCSVCFLFMNEGWAKGNGRICRKIGSSRLEDRRKGL